MRLSVRTKLVALTLLILILAVGLVSYRGLTFFLKDKETYVYDLVSQVLIEQEQKLNQRLASIEQMLGIFSDVSTFQLNSEQQSKVLKNYRDYLYIGLFSVDGVSTKEISAIANTRELTRSGLSAQQLTAAFSKAQILTTENANKRIAVYDLTSVIGQDARLETPLITTVLNPSPGKVVVSVMPSHAVLDLASGKKIYDTFVLDHQGNPVIYDPEQSKQPRTTLAASPMATEFTQNPTLTLTKQYTLADGTAIISAFAGLETVDLGIFVCITKDQAFLAAKRLMKASAMWTVGIFIFTCLLGFAFAYTLTKPLNTLAQLTVKIAKGDFSVKAPISSKDEIGELGHSFNRMSEELHLREERLQEAHQQLVQSEKMSAFGQMSAGIAHEVKNPLAGILGYAQLAQRKVEEDSPIKKHLATIEKETKRCRDIIDKLMRFARQEETVFEATNLNQVLEESVALVDHQIGISGIAIDVRLDPKLAEKLIKANANQLEQVLMNLMLNAQHALEKHDPDQHEAEKSKKIRVGTQAEEDHAIVFVADNGPGIDPENRKKIFEPFFTTKPAGEGTGLGLAVSYGIIRDHQGKIDIESTVGQGTLFTIRLPYDQAANHT